MANVSISMVFLLLLLAGGVGLQIFLSKRKSRWPGLVIPFICFLYSVLMVCSVNMYDTRVVSQSTTMVDGVMVREEVEPMQKENPGMITVLGKVISVFLIGNLPTAGYLAIYFACRQSNKKHLELDKMHIQDLE